MPDEATPYKVNEVTRKTVKRLVERWNVPEVPVLTFDQAVQIEIVRKLDGINGKLNLFVLLALISIFLSIIGALF